MTLVDELHNHKRDHSIIWANKSYGQIYLLPESSLLICKCKHFMFYATLHSIWTYFENRKTFPDFILQPIGKVFQTFLFLSLK